MKNLFNFRMISVCLIIFFGVNGQIIADEWEVKASVDVTQSGIVEALLLPELMMKRPDGRYDLAMTGPDGHPRPFELFMKENSGMKTVLLKPVTIKLGNQGGFIWESSAPQILLNEIRVHIADRNYLGKISVEGKTENTWRYIARNQAVYKTGGAARATIDIQDGVYQRLRLHFAGFDKRYDKKIVPINSVTGYSTIKKRDYTEKKIDLTRTMRLAESDDYTEANLILPGKGIELTTLDFLTEIQFQGRWEIGVEEIKNGKSVFTLKQTGMISHVDGSGKTVNLTLNRAWNSRSLVLRLKPDAGFLGSLQTVMVTARLPRLVFSADTPGIYTAISGMGKRIKILTYAGDSKRVADQTVYFGKPTINPYYDSQTLVEKYQIKGGPFNSDGYIWNSRLSVPGAGYYRLTMNLQASLDDNYSTVRLEKNGTQIPFFFGRNEDKTLDLETSAAYDAENNKTAWVVTLPEISSRWKSLILRASGIFSRDVSFFKKKPGNTGWEKVLTKRWVHSGIGKTRLKLRYPHALLNDRQFKIEIEHGDNQPLSITTIQSLFRSPSLCFLAHEAGDYYVYGGNETAGVAQYDLSLVQNRLLETLPVELEMAESERTSGGAWSKRIVQLFQGQSIGLYVILGLVTLVLIVIIIRLFPSLEKTE